MKFECDSCNAQYMIADEKLGDRGVKVKCKRCSHVIIVRPSAAAAEDPEPEQEASADFGDEGFGDEPFGDDAFGADAFGDDADDGDGDGAADDEANDDGAAAAPDVDFGDSPFGDESEGLDQDELDAFSGEFDGSEARATAETAHAGEFGGDTEVAGHDTELGLDVDEPEEPPPDRTMVTAAPRMTDEEEVPPPAPPEADDAFAGGELGGFDDPMEESDGANPFASFGSQEGAAEPAPAFDGGDDAFGGAEDTVGASDDPFGAAEDDAVDDEQGADPFGASDPFGDDGDDDGDVPAPALDDAPADAFGDTPAAADPFGAEANDGEPDPVADEVPAPPPEAALPSAPAAPVSSMAAMPEPEGEGGDALEGELAGAFSAMFDSPGGGFGGGLPTEEGPDPRGPTQVVDIGEMDQLRAQSAPTQLGDAGGAFGLDDLRADLDSSLGDGPTAWNADAGATARDGLPEDEEPEWHVAIDDEDVGPINRKQFLEHINKGEVDRESLCWKAGLDDWEAAGEIPELRELFDSAPMPDISGEGPALTPAFDVGAPIDDLAPSPFGGDSGPQPAADPFAGVPGAGDLTTDEQDPSWQPHGLTEVYQAANLAEAAATVGTPGSTGGGGIGSLDDDDGADGWRPGAANALASLVSAELSDSGGGDDLGEMSLPPAADDSLNTSLDDASLGGGLGDIGAPPSLGGLDSLGGASPKPAQPPAAPMDDFGQGAPLGGGLMGPAQSIGGMPMTPFGPQQDPPWKNPLVLAGGGAVLLLIILLTVLVVKVFSGPPAQPPIAAQVPGQVPGQVAMAVPGQPAPGAPGAVAPAAAAAAAAPAAAAEPAAAEPAAAAPAAEPAAEEPKPTAAAKPRTKKPTTRRATTTRTPKPEPPKPDPPKKRRRDCDPILDLDCDEKPRTSSGGGGGKRTLSPSDVLTTVRKNLGSVNRCGSKHGVKGTVKMEWRILKSGRTSSVRVMTPKYAGTPVGNCMISSIKSWKFPSFTGSPPPPVKFPFKLKG